MWRWCLRERHVWLRCLGNQMFWWLGLIRWFHFLIDTSNSGTWHCHELAKTSKVLQYVPLCDKTLQKPWQTQNAKMMPNIIDIFLFCKITFLYSRKKEVYCFFNPTWVICHEYLFCFSFFFFVYSLILFFLMVKVFFVIYESSVKFLNFHIRYIYLSPNLDMK